MYSAKNLFAWLLLFGFAIMLMVMAIEGSAGKVFAVVFTPSELDVSNG